MAKAAKKGDALSQWTRLTPTMKVGVMFLVALLLGGVYWQFLLKDLRAEKESEVSSRENLLRTQAGLNGRIDALEKLKTQRDALEAEVAGLEFALPNEAELNSFLDHLQTKAGDAGVAFKSWKNENEAPAGKYIKVPMQVTVEGNFYQLMNYMYLLGPSDKGDGAAAAAGTAKFDRIVTVENLDISEANLRNDEILLTATFTAATFRQEAPPAPPAPAAPAAPAGAAPRPGAPAAPGGAAAPTGATAPAKPFGDTTQVQRQGNKVVRDAKGNAEKAGEAIKKGINEGTGAKQ